jgi:hypothetical protein
VDDYFAAWNEPVLAGRRALLERCVTPEVEVIHPSWGRTVGIDPLLGHIDRYRAAMPDTSIVPSSGIDHHNTFLRYGWKVVDASGEQQMEGLDVVELADDGRLKQIVLFHGRLSDE